MIILKPGAKTKHQVGLDNPLEGGAVAAMSDPQTSAEWLMRQAQEPRAVREWASALRRPVETIFEEAVIREPNRMARLFAPILDAAMTQQRHSARAKFFDNLWRWVTSLTTPKVWGWTLRALWEGENPWRYVEERALWFEVVEVAVFDPRTGALLAKSESPSRAVLRHAAPLECIPLLGSASAQLDAQEGEHEASTSAESQLIILVGQRCRMAVRVTGQPPLSLRASLQNLCHEADSILERTANNPSWTRQLLEGVALRALQGEGPATRVWTLRHGMAMLSLLLVLAVAGLSWVGVREYRWQTFLGLLDGEPGVQVISQTTAWGQTLVEGIRDPEARDPKLLALSMGIGLNHVSLRFPSITVALAESAGPRPIIAHRTGATKQLSTTIITPQFKPLVTTVMEPQAVGLKEITTTTNLASGASSARSVETVRVLMRLPESLKLSLQGNRLIAQGALAEPDYSRLAAAPQKFAWIAAVEMADVQDITNAEIHGHQRAIAAVHITFQPDSDALAPGSEASLTSLVNDIQALVIQSALKSQKVRLGFCGKDPSEADSPIEAGRQAALQLALMRLGVSPECFAQALPTQVTATLMPSDCLALQVTLIPTSI